MGDTLSTDFSSKPNRQQSQQQLGTKGVNETNGNQGPPREHLRGIFTSLPRPFLTVLTASGGWQQAKGLGRHKRKLPWNDSLGCGMGHGALQGSSAVSLA